MYGEGAGARADPDATPRLAAALVARNFRRVYIPPSVMPLLGDDSEIADGVLHVQIDRDGRAFRAGIDPASVALLQPGDVGFADEAGRARREADAGRQANGGVARARLHADAVALGRSAAQVHVEVAGAEPDRQALQVDAAEHQPRVASAEGDAEIDRRRLVEAQAPLVLV